MKNKPDGRQPALLTSLVKALAVLDRLVFINSADGGISLKDLAKDLQYPANTTHKILQTLCECAYARQVERGRYCAGEKISQLRRGGRVISESAREAATEELRWFSAEYKEACALSVLRDGNRVVVAKVDSAHIVQVPELLVDREPFYTHTSTRLLLAYADSRALEQVIRQHGLPGDRWGGIDTREMLLQNLQEIRAHGCIVRDDSNDEVTSAVVAVFLQDGSFWGTVGSYAPSYRMKGKLKKDWLSALLQLAETLSSIVAF